MGAADELQALAVKLLALGSVPAETARGAAGGLQQLVAEEFQEGAGPSGPWAPLSPRTRGRTPPPLTATGELAGSLEVSTSDGGLEVQLGDEVAALHQAGTRHMPARPIFPAGDSIPPTWEGALERAADEAVRAAMGGSP